MLPLPAGREARSGAGGSVYERHRPERTLLYQLVQEYYPALKAQLAAQGTELPAYVQREFEAYLKCSRLEGGFPRVRPDGSLRLRWVKAPNGAEIMQLAYTIAHRFGRFLKRHGLLESDAENSYLAGEGLEAEPLDQLLGSSSSYRGAVGLHQGRKVFTLQTLPAIDE